MKKNLLTGILAFVLSTSFAQTGIFGTDANGNQTERCSTAGWDKSDCSLTKIKAGNVLPDRNEVNCQGVSKTLYGVLAEGKPLVIYAEAWGCPPCWGTAPEKADYIQTHKATINFWIPLCEYLGNDAVCSTSNRLDRRSVEGWQNSFPGLKDAFMFIDNDRTWNLDGMPAQPGVGVIDPKTKKLVYSGYDFAKAEALAEKMASSITANEEPMIEQYYVSFYPNPAKDKLFINTGAPRLSIQLLTMDGRLILESNYNSSSTTLDLNEYSKGLYILKINNKAQQVYID